VPNYSGFVLFLHDLLNWLLCYLMPQSRFVDVTCVCFCMLSLVLVRVIA